MSLILLLALLARSASSRCCIRETPPRPEEYQKVKIKTAKAQQGNPPAFSTKPQRRPSLTNSRPFPLNIHTQPQPTTHHHPHPPQPHLHDILPSPIPHSPSPKSPPHTKNATPSPQHPQHLPHHLPICNQTSRLDTPNDAVYPAPSG